MQKTDESQLTSVKKNLRKKSKIMMSLNKQFNMSRKKIKNKKVVKRYTEDNVIMEKSTSPNTVLNNQSQASRFPQAPKLMSRNSNPEKSKLITFLINIEIGGTRTSRHKFDPVNGFIKHVVRNRAKKIIKQQLSQDEIDNNLPITPIMYSKSSKSRNVNPNSSSKISKTEAVSYAERRKQTFENDYLFKKRVERELNPERHFKRRNFWNISLKENFDDEDYFIKHFKAQEVQRKALAKEKRVLESLSEKEKLEQNNEIDKMLLRSLKAKLELINGL